MKSQGIPPRELLRPVDVSPETHRTILTAARRLRVPVRYWVATRFDVTISRIDKPGMMSRKVMRRGPVNETFQATMDEHWIVIDL